MTTEDTSNHLGDAGNLHEAQTQEGNDPRQDAPVSASPVPFEASGVDLPADPDSIEFALALQDLKPLFGSRTEYNYMVCDQLALRGVAPNGLNVRKAGSWGAPVAVGADVKAWYTALSARLSSEHAKIPEAAKRSANKLIEQLWTLAAESVGQPLEEKLAQARQTVQEQSEAFAEEIEHLRRELDITRGDHDEVKELLGQARKEISVLETARRDLSAEVDTLGRSIAQAALENEQARRDLERMHAQAIDRLRAAAADAAGVHANEMERARTQIQTERDRVDQAAKSHALAIDGFRQDLRRAVERGDKAHEDAAHERSAANALREQLSSAHIEKSSIEKKLENAAADIARLQKEAALKVIGAWAHDEDPSRVISQIQKEQSLRDGGASASSVQNYSIPLIFIADADSA